MKPELFECTCKWKYLRLDKKTWWGPFFSGPSSNPDPIHSGRLMTHKRFKEEYSDCHHVYHGLHIKH